MSSLDFSALSDDQLVELIRAALQEAVRRGSAVEAAARSVGLEEAEEARIAQEAARREAERLQREEAERIARQAAEQVRREAERKKEQEAIDEAAKLRAHAARARELFGSGWGEFQVQVWSKEGDRRVYIQADYDRKFVTYYHTGNSRTAPGTLTEDAKWPVKERAAALGITEEQARRDIKDFCAALCREWKGLKLEVNTSNAPRDPRCAATRYLLKRKGEEVWAHKDNRSAYWSREKSEADAWKTPEEALAALSSTRGYLGTSPTNLAPSADGVELDTRQGWNAFPPKKKEAE